MKPGESVQGEEMTASLREQGLASDEQWEALADYFKKKMEQAKADGDFASEAIYHSSYVGCRQQIRAKR